MKPLVITVHGINSDGEWQNAVEKVLAPHCECRHFRYRDYRYFGFALQLVTLREHVTLEITRRIVARDRREVAVETKAIEARQRAEENYTAGTIKQIWEAVGQGMAAVAALQTTSQPDLAKIRLLSPRAAVEKALEALPEEAFSQTATVHLSPPLALQPPNGEVQPGGGELDS